MRAASRTVGVVLVTAVAAVASGCGSEPPTAATRASDPARASDDVARTPSTATTMVVRPKTRGRAPTGAAKDAEGTGDLRRLVGQKFVVSFRGTASPPASLLERIRRGEVGGVILFSENASPPMPAGFRAVADRLQAAAAAGHNPPLLIMTDQEGGDVRRVPGPPVAAPLTYAAAPVSRVRALGEETGRSLRSMGIDVDLAPVVDLPPSSSTFLGGRVFGYDKRATKRSVAFAEGLQATRVAATAKHYPGLGRTGISNTDETVVRVGADRATLDRERRGFLRHARRGTKLVMVSSAIYDGYDPDLPAVLSSKVLEPLRRDYGGVIVSDDITTPAIRAYGDRALEMATDAGVDLFLYAATDGAGAFRRYLRAVRRGDVSRQAVTEQVRRVIALKRWAAG